MQLQSLTATVALPPKPKNKGILEIPYDIIPDIHGQSEKLHARLSKLGYHLRHGAWRHPNPDRQCVFLGDFIDRGPNNGAVLCTVRAMQEAGTGLAVMGNHELNAIRFHTTHPETGDGFRERTEKNTRQHASFLHEFPLGDRQTGPWIDWLCSLPLYFEFDAFRAVHACWDDVSIGALRGVSPDGRLTRAEIVSATDANHPLHEAIETTTKGPERHLPEGYFFSDKDGAKRTSVRVQWWQNGAKLWHELAASVPDPAELPSGQVPRSISARTYREDARPVLFGHYWLSGTPRLQASNALCLDYSAGTDGPLVSYAMDKEQPTLCLNNLTN